MLRLITRHSLVAIFFAVALEELGVPMPIPTDLLIIFAGVRAGRGLPSLVLWFALLSVASAAGASGLYAIVRRGGRPLVERFGKYVHLGPDQLARAERFLMRRGWSGIAIGRAIPGLRYVTVIACGLLNVPYWRFLTAHLVGSSLYIATFLALGALFGPSVLSQIQIPHLALRLLWLVALAVGLPALLVWVVNRAGSQRPAIASRRRVFLSELFASGVGTIAFAATLALAAAIAELSGAPAPLRVVYRVSSQFWGTRGSVPGIVTLEYGLLLVLCVAVGAVYEYVVMPRPSFRARTRIGEVLGLTVLGTLVVGGVLAALVTTTRTALPWSAGSLLLGGLIVALGMLSYAVTAVHAQTLAMALVPSRRRTPAPEGATTP